MKRHLIAAAGAVFLSLLAGGCAGPNLTAPKSQPLGRAVITDGTAFTASENPFIYNGGQGRNSSDPAAVWAPTPQGDKLLMVTSNDLQKEVPSGGNYYPMNQTFLYVLDPNNTGNNNWRDFGAILSESDIPWTNQTTRPENLWAPDIDFRTVNNVTTYYCFVPDVDQATGNQKIAVFTRQNDPFGSFAGGYKNYVRIMKAGNVEAPYSYDPGVFHLGAGNDISDYYLAYCNGTFNQNGRIEIARFVDDGQGGLTKANHLGQIQINGLSGDFYMEGPDLIEVDGTGDRQQPMILLQFAAKVNEEQEYIGYAYKTRASFVADPVTNWTFGGWIQKQIDPSPGENPSAETAEWTNHATIVPVQLTGGAMKYYYLYQYSEGDNTAEKGQMRQVSMRELKLNTDLTIQGPSSDGSNSLGHEPYPFDGIAYTAQTADASANSTQSRFRMFINNPTDSSASSWAALYYFRTESGKTPVLSNGSSALAAGLRRFGTDVWAVQFETGTAMAGRYQEPNWGQFPQSGPGYDITLSYSDGSAFDKSNDFSQARSAVYTNTDRVPIFSSQTGRMAGRNPKLNVTTAWTTFTGNTLTASTEQVNGENLVVGMPAQAWDTQEWEFEPVPGTSYVRIKLPKWGTYLNVSTTNEREKIVLHSLVPDWWSQQWQLVPVTNNPSQMWIINRWTGKYLTRGNPNDNLPHDRPDYISVWSQSGNPAWDSQKWLVTYD